MNHRTSLIVLMLAFVAFTGLFTACQDMRCYREDFVFEYGNGCVSACSEGEWLDVCPDRTTANECYYNERIKRVACRMNSSFKPSDPKACYECENIASDWGNDFRECGNGVCGESDKTYYYHDDDDDD